MKSTRELFLDVVTSMAETRSMYVNHTLIESVMYNAATVEALQPIEYDLLKSLSETNNLDTCNYFAVCVLKQEGQHEGLRSWIAKRAKIIDNPDDSGFVFLTNALTALRQRG